MDSTNVCYHYPDLPKPLVTLLKCIEFVNYCIWAIGFYLGLNPSFDSRSFVWDDQRYDAMISEMSSTPSATTKQRLRVLEYYAYRGKEPTVCSVCLCDLKARDEVRELGNCRHVFHKGCIDEWLDRGKLTCPVCRSMLLPAEERNERRSTLLGFMEKLW